MTFVIKKVTFVTVDNSYNKKGQLRMELAYFVSLYCLSSCAFHVHSVCITPVFAAHATAIMHLKLFSTGFFKRADREEFECL